MIISGMNRYFAKHGRIIGLVILPIIIVTFVFYFGRGSSMDMFSGKGKASEVSILGRTVTLKDRQDEVTRIYLVASLQNPGINLSNARMPLNSKSITLNLLQNYAAEDMGIAVGDKEISEYLKTVPAFQTAGKFDAAKYDLYLKNNLKPAYLTQSDLKDAVQRMLQVQALRKSISDNVIVPDVEIKEVFMSDMQTVDAKILKFNAADYAKGLTFKDEQLQRYYKSNKDNYKTSPGVRGKIVTFTFDSFKKDALAQVTEKDMLKYYEDNKFRYTLPADPKKKDVKKKSQPEPPKYKKFEEVKGEIKKTLADKKAEELALAKSQKFADNVAILASDVFYDISDKDKAKIRCMEIFKTASAKEKLKIADSGWLSLEGNQGKGFSKETALIKAMNELLADNPVSEPVKGEKGFFVAILDDKKSSESKSFEKAKEDVRKDLIDSKALVLAREDARKKALEIGELLDKKVKLADIEKKLKVKFNKLPSWSAQMLNQMAMYFQGNSNMQLSALKLAFATKTGDLSSVSDTADGAYFVYVVKKNIPTEKEFSKQKTRFSMNYRRVKKGAAYNNFLSELMQSSGLAKKK
jgi:hypothetical protein